MPCVECLSANTDIERRDDEHFYKTCNDCGHDWGPFISSYDEREPEPAPSGQGGLDGWASN